MKAWHKYTIIGVASLVLNVLAGVAVLILTGTWPTSGTGWPFLLVGFALAYLWYLLFVLPAMKRQEGTITALEAKLNNRALPEDAAEAAQELIAKAVASIYDNPVNDHYRKAAGAVTPAIVETIYDLVEADMLSQAGTASERYIKVLEDSRDKILAAYTEQKAKHYDALASNTWQGLEKVNAEIEKEKAKFRGNREPY